MAPEVLTSIIGAGCTVAASIITFILTKRKYNTEVDSQVISNLNNAFSAYKEMTNETIKVLNDKIDSLQRENDNLRNQLGLVQAQMVNMMIGKEIGMFDTSKKDTDKKE